VKFSKGDIVTVEAETFTALVSFQFITGDCILEHEVKILSGKDKDNGKNLYAKKYESPIECVVLGRSYLATGYYYNSTGHDYDYEPAYLQEDKRHPVYVLEPIGFSAQGRYLKPIRSLERYMKLKG
jgi:hypothetical protein